MKHLITFLFIFIFAGSLFAQDQNILREIKGKVINAKDDLPIERADIINLNTLKGTNTIEDGAFKIMARVSDTLFFSYLGYENISVRVTEDWLKYGEVTIAMTEQSIALQEVKIEDLALTGYLEIDARRAPIYANRRYKINGLPIAYEAGNEDASAITRVLNSLFNPADFLYNTFSREGKNLRKLRQIKKEDELRVLLQSKFDREILVNLLQMDKVNIDAILVNCEYSKQFITDANDLQILDAISECYERYKVLKKN